MKSCAAVLAVALLAGACHGQGAVNLQTQLPPGFEVRLDNVVYQRADRFGHQAEANTAEVLLSPSTGLASFDRIELKHRADLAYGGEVDIVAGAGTANLFTGRVNLRRGVRVEDGLGRVLQAPSAAYNPGAEAVAGPGPATLTGPNYLLRAETGFVADTERGVIDLLGPVSGYADELPESQGTQKQKPAPRRSPAKKQGR